MKTPNLIPNMLSYYKSIAKSEGVSSAIQQLSGERVLTSEDLRRGRLSPEEAAEMMNAYNHVENALGQQSRDADPPYHMDDDREREENIMALKGKIPRKPVIDLKLPKKLPPKPKDMLPGDFHHKPKK